MAYAARKPLIKKNTAINASHPAPVGGWNARDSLAAMDEKDAVILDNWWPLPSNVIVRNGYTQWATGLPSYVQSMFNYGGASGQKLFAASGTAFYEVTSGGAVGAPVVTALSNAKWEYVNISTSGGNFLCCVNGTDKLQGYNGTTWWKDGDGTHDITGVDTATWCHINLFKNRLWGVQKNSLKTWYLPLSSIGGAAQALDFSSIAREGGSLVAMFTWTIDAGYGVDDLAGWITDQGEIIVYRGTDPTSASTWALVGVWSVGAPFSKRCAMKWGGDVLILTYDGVFPLASYLQSSRLDPRVAITDKIYTAISQATSDYATNFCWGMEYYAKANMLIINIPVNDTDGQIQFAMNTITKQWCSFSNVPACCWELLNDDVYFGGNGYVAKFWNGNTDYPTSTGQNINSNCLTAFSTFGKDGIQKRWTMLRPIFLTNGQPAAFGGMNVDFDLSDYSGQLSFQPSGFAQWDSATWDTALWGGALSISKNWQSTNGVGNWAAIRVKTATMEIETHWISTNYVMEKGATL
jgi:hypothetical protein